MSNQVNPRPRPGQLYKVNKNMYLHNILPEGISRYHLPKGSIIEITEVKEKLCFLDEECFLVNIPTKKGAIWNIDNFQSTIDTGFISPANENVPIKEIKEPINIIPISQIK